MATKEKTCQICKVKFTPLNPMQKVCGFNCALQYANNKKIALERTQSLQDRKTIRLLRDGIKTKSELAREAQTVFNQFIRLRDEKLPCISCGRFHQGQYHAGHYRTVGSHPELRFEELNVHKQCSVCNNHKSGNIVEYRIHLLAKIGASNLEWLEGHHDLKKYTIEDYKEIKSIYRAKLKELKNG